MAFDIVGNSVRMRKAGEQRRGAALVNRMTLLTRDARRYRTYFPALRIVAP